MIVKDGKSIFRTASEERSLEKENNKTTSEIIGMETIKISKEISLRRKP